MLQARGFDAHPETSYTPAAAEAQARAQLEKRLQELEELLKSRT
jgi:hypothetical protein